MQEQYYYCWRMNIYRKKEGVERFISEFHVTKRKQKNSSTRFRQIYKIKYINHKVFIKIDHSKTSCQMCIYKIKLIANYKPEKIYKNSSFFIFSPSLHLSRCKIDYFY